MLGRKAGVTAAVGATAAATLAFDDRLRLGHDLWVAGKLAPVLLSLKRKTKTPGCTIAEVWLESVSKFPDQTFIIFEHRRLTFKDVDIISNQMAHWLRAQDITPGQAIALMMENKPEFVCWWLAMAKIGVKAALLNYNLTGKGLAHCIREAASVAVVFDADTEANLHTIDANLKADGVKAVFWGGRQPRADFSTSLLAVEYDQLLGFPYGGDEFAALRKGMNFEDVFGYIYTSGTTGLPKAAKIMHVKMATIGMMSALLNLGTSDRMYTCLPIYHTAGGAIGVMSCMLSGATLVLSRKFSASRFWHEISAHGCTAFQYIGELGRYLVNHAREHPEVRKIPHKLRGAIGNGLRPEVWDEFQEGFNIPVVLEFYGATEGNGALLNYCRKEDRRSRGAVGKMGAVFRKVMGFRIVRFDVESEAPIRGPDGFCQEAAPGEPGELLLPIVESDPTKRFVGYTDEAASQKKVLRDVFDKGDAWFRSGDLLSQDGRGLWFFVDRIGDTFRWKGENVSTMEVSEVLSSFPGVEEANVYGVKVPGVEDGRGCMAAINCSEELQRREKLDELQKLCEKELPSYARPLFLRFLPAMDITGTFKHQKVKLREEGCDPSKISDPIYVFHPSARRYERLDMALYQQLQGGQSKL